MGWTTFHKPDTETVKATLQREVFDFSGDDTRRLLDLALVGSVAYAAVERIHPDGHREVSAYVVLTDRDRHSRFNFGYKDMHEQMGPCESRCPARILDLLTPVEAQGECAAWADHWRLRCRTHLKQAKATRALGDGATIRFASPLRFPGIAPEFSATTFQLSRQGRSVLFYPTNAPAVACRIPRWQEREFAVVI